MRKSERKKREIEKRAIARTETKTVRPDCDVVTWKYRATQADASKDHTYTHDHTYTREIEQMKKVWIEIGVEVVCGHEEKARGQNPCVGPGRYHYHRRDGLPAEGYERAGQGHMFPWHHVRWWLTPGLPKGERMISLIHDDSKDESEKWDK